MAKRKSTKKYYFSVEGEKEGLARVWTCSIQWADSLQLVRQYSNSKTKQTTAIYEENHNV